MQISKLGIVGCGIMGSGIAQVCAQSRYHVVVLEMNDELLKNGVKSINLFLTKSVERGKISSQDKESTMNRIRGTTNINDLHECNLIIEAVTENMNLKKDIFSALDKICPSDCILASNTSALSIVDMAMATNRPDRVLGLHFSNPAPIMRLVEIVRAVTTSNETVNTAIGFCKSLGKEFVIVPDLPGFLANRLMIPHLLNAIRLFETNFATKEDIDKTVTLTGNVPMGPLTLADFIGLDTLYFVARSMHEELKDPIYAPPPLLKKMITAGWLGRKTKKGFYEYA